METGQVIVIAFNIFIAFTYVTYIAKVYHKQANMLLADMTIKATSFVKLFIHF